MVCTTETLSGEIQPGYRGILTMLVVQGNTTLDLFTNPVNPAQLEIGGNLIIGNAIGMG
jgi:hypothetical protein